MLKQKSRQGLIKNTPPLAERGWKELHKQVEMLELLFLEWVPKDCLRFPARQQQTQKTERLHEGSGTGYNHCPVQPNHQPERANNIRKRVRIGCCNHGGGRAKPV
jgi:hypothetical protein